MYFVYNPLCLTHDNPMKIYYLHFRAGNTGSNNRGSKWNKQGLNLGLSISFQVWAREVGQKSSLSFPLIFYSVFLPKTHSVDLMKNQVMQDQCPIGPKIAQAALPCVEQRIKNSSSAHPVIKFWRFCFAPWQLRHRASPPILSPFHFSGIQ